MLEERLEASSSVRFRSVGKIRKRARRRGDSKKRGWNFGGGGGGVAEKESGNTMATEREW